MKINNRIELHQFIRSLWEQENNLWDSEIEALIINKLSYKVECKVYHDNTSTEKAVLSELKSFVEATSVCTIMIVKDAFCVSTDLFNIIYDFHGTIISVEEL